MARGGRRPGAGRKPGSKNRITMEREQRIAASGMAPLDYLLSVMRDPSAPLPVRFDAAKAAARFVHPRLAAVEHSGGLDVRQASDMSDDELAAIIAQHGAAKLVN